MKPFDVVRVVHVRGDRFVDAKPDYERSPMTGDIGTVLEIYTDPELAFEVECVKEEDGTTVWLEAMYPEELEPYP